MHSERLVVRTFTVFSWLLVAFLDASILVVIIKKQSSSHFSFSLMWEAGRQQRSYTTSQSKPEGIYGTEVSIARYGQSAIRSKRTISFRRLWFFSLSEISKHCILRKPTVYTICRMPHSGLVWVCSSTTDDGNQSLSLLQQKTRKNPATVTCIQCKVQGPSCTKHKPSLSLETHWPLTGIDPRNRRNQPASSRRAPSLTSN
jgi:hypothetical protein